MQHIPLTEILLLLFFCITFGFSAYEKIFDFKGQINWLTEYFKGTLMEKLVKISVIKILILEVITTGLCLAGIIQLFTRQTKDIALWGCLTGIAVLLAFLTGQRIVKDYDGARNTVIYLIPSFFLLHLLTC